MKSDSNQALKDRSLDNYSELFREIFRINQDHQLKEDERI